MLVAIVKGLVKKLLHVHILRHKKNEKEMIGHKIGMKFESKIIWAMPRDCRK